MVAISTPAETRTLLENISWETFKVPRFIQEARINGELSTSRACRAWVREKIHQTNAFDN